VTHIALGDDREAHADLVRRAGLKARVAHFERGWRESDALELAG
jgi:hypothetical protein